LPLDGDVALVPRRARARPRADDVVDAAWRAAAAAVPARGAPIRPGVGPDRAGAGSARASTRASRVPINGRVTTTRRRAAGGLRARRVLAVVAAAVLASTVAVAAIPGSPATAAPNPASSATGDNTPAARIATLGAIADGADATLATAVARRNGLEHDLTLAVEALGQAEAATAALNVAAAQAQARYD